MNVKKSQPRHRPHMLGLWITLLLILALAVAGCGRGDKTEDAATPAPASAPAATSAPAASTGSGAATVPAQPAPAQPAGSPGGTTASSGERILSPGDVLNSFRAVSQSRFATTYSDGRVAEEIARFQVTFVRTDGPFGYDEVFELVDLSHDDGEEDEDLTMTLYAVGENMAMRSGDQWTVSARTVENQPGASFEVFTGMSGDVGDILENATRIGDETVNGVAATRYRVDDKGVFEMLMDAMLDEEEGELARLEYDIWVAKSGDFVVKYALGMEVKDAPTFDAAGNDVIAPKMEIEWSYELYEVNGPVVIEWPADAPQPGQIDMPGFDSGSFPLPPETQVESTMFGIVALVSALSPEAVTAFYDESLTELGWSKEGFGGFFNWTKGDLSLSIVIGPDEEQGGSRITLMPN